MERVIFRKVKGEPGHTIAIFPDDDANYGRFGGIEFYVDKYGYVKHYPYDEMSYDYIMSCPIIHVNDPAIPGLLDDLAAVLDCDPREFRVVEKITSDMRDTAWNSRYRR